MSTTEELAEVIADLNERNRVLCEELDEQNDIIVEYKLYQENEDKRGAALENDLRDALDKFPGAGKGMRSALESILANYFGVDE